MVPKKSSTSVRRVIKKRKFYAVGYKIATRVSGFHLLNGDNLFKGGPPTFLPPLGQRGFSDYPERPVFLSDAKLGRLHWDIEEYSGYWLISDRMKSVLQGADPEAFAFLQCDVRTPDGKDAPVRWFCDVIRVLDALDEGRSAVKIGTADDGSKVYNFGYGASLTFNESVVGNSYIFRMKYSASTIICDEAFKQACKSANVVGLSFQPTAEKKRIVHPPRVPRNEALYVKIAKILSQDADLVERYRGAVARLPKLDWRGREYSKNEAVVAVAAILKEMDGIVKKLEPGISSKDRGQVHRYFIDWVSGQRKFD